MPLLLVVTVVGATTTLLVHSESWSMMGKKNKVVSSTTFYKQ